MEEIKSKVLDTTILNYQSVVEIGGSLYRYAGKYERSWTFGYRFIPLAGQRKKAVVKLTRKKLSECWLIQNIGSNSHVFGNSLQLSIF